MTTNNLPGIGDPYWYEWSVGQTFLVKMLNSDNEILSVTFQEPSIAGWDDILVEHQEGIHYYQIKHTRIDDTITFGDLVSVKEGKSLLSYLADCWKKIDYHDKARFVLFTNREIGNKFHTVTINGNEIKRPPLENFFSQLKYACSNNSAIDLKLIDESYLDALNKEWLPAMKNLNEEQICQFLNSFEIQTGQPNLEELGLALIKQIQAIFSITEIQANSIFESLNSALRKWTTTLRRSNKITKEDVYQSLRKEAEEISGNHNLTPPYPFFQSRESILSEIENAISDETYKIIFLSGNPGTGKTSVISKLTNNVFPLIHLRYYTFYPISPDNDIIPMDAGNAVTTRRLWGDLLSQFRILLKGNLAKYEVPIRNDFIQDPIKLREHVIRLACIVSKEILHRRIVICIDGIDHAARAGLDSIENYIGSLIPPENIPSEILFIIAGQPTDSYPQYPIWLKENRSNVRKIFLENLNIQDIENLCNNEQIDNAQSIAQELHRITSGNTLSIIYAIATIQKHNDKIAALKELSELNMHDGLIAYYESIWKKMSTRFENQTFPNFLASFFSLTTAKLKAEHFVYLLSEYNLQIMDCKTYLHHLSPLVIEDDDGYRILHNDVRVFFSKIILSDRKDIYKNSASRLIDLYLKNENFCYHRHADLLRLLLKSENPSKILEILNPRFILEAYVCRSQKDETYGQIKLALFESIKKKSFDILHNISCSILTFNQLESSLIETNSSWNFSNINQSFMNELKVLNIGEWNVDIIEEVMEQILILFHNNEYLRAKGLWERWFVGINFNELLFNFIKNDNEKEHSLMLSHQLQELFKSLGKISINIILNSTTEKQINLEPTTEIENVGVANFTSGLVEEALTIGSVRAWNKVLKYRFASYYQKDFNTALLNLSNEKKWFNIIFILKNFDKNIFSSEYKNLAYFIALLTRRKLLIDKWNLNHKDLLVNITESGIEKIDFANRYLFFILTSFILGWKETSKDASEIVDSISNIVFSRGHDQRDEMPSKVIFRFSIELGQWFREIFDENKSNNFIFMNLNRLKEIISILLNFHNKFSGVFFQIDKAIKFLLEIIIYSVEKSEDGYQKVLDEIFDSHFSSKLIYDQHFPIIWNYFFKKGMYVECGILLDRVIGEDGKLWSWSIGDIFSTLDELEKLTEKTQYFEQVKTTRIKSRWYQVGIISHKDYSFYTVYNWLEIHLQKSPESWLTDGQQLLSLSFEFSERGDNRAHREIEKLIMSAALRTNPGAFYYLYNKLIRNDFKNKHSLLVEVIEEYFDDFNFSEDNLKLLWILGCGTTYWIDHSDRNLLQSLKLTILSSNSVASCQEIEKYLSSTYPLENNIEMYLQSDPQKEKVFTLSKNIEDELNDYLTLGSHDLSRLPIIINEIGTKHPKNFAELIDKIIFSLTLYPNKSSWRFSGLEKVYKALLPLLTIEQQWSVAEDIIYKFYNVDEYAFLSSLGSTLDSFTLYSNLSNRSVIKSGLYRLQSMYKNWINGFGITDLTSENVEINNHSGESLEIIVFKILIDKLDTRSSIQIEAAIKGVYNYLLQDSSGFNYLCLIWSDLSHDQRDYLLFSFEAIIATKPDCFEKMQPILEQAYRSDRLSHRLQTYLIYLQISKITGDKIPLFAFKESEILKNFSNLIPGVNDILEVITNGGSVSQSSHLYQSKYKFLLNANLIKDEERFLKYISYLEINSPSDTLENKNNTLFKDFIISNRRSDDIINEVFDHIAFLPGKQNYPIARVAQCLLSNDDPLSLLNPYLPHPTPDIWSLRNDFSTDEIKGKLNYIMNSEINDDCVLIGGEIYVFTSEKKYVLRYNTYITNSKFLTPRLKWDYTFNLRSSFIKDINIFQPRNSSNGLFVISGGISKLFYMNNWIMPSSIVMNKIGWEIDQINPSVLLKNNKKIAWQEKYIGNISIETEYYSVPAMQRWVCYKKDLDIIKSQFQDMNVKGNYEIIVDKFPWKN